MSDPFYKWLAPDRTTPVRGYRWPVRARQWTPRQTPVRCQSGWHLAPPGGITPNVPWTLPAVLWTAEGRGATDAAPDKVVFESARILAPIGTLTEPMAHSLACDFAEHVLPLWEAKHPNDHGPRVAIEARRRAMTGDGSAGELYAAAAGAARAYAAHYASDDPSAICAAYAAYGAAGAAISTYAYAATNLAEREWQGRRILEVLNA